MTQSSALTSVRPQASTPASPFVVGPTSSPVAPSDTARNPKPVISAEALADFQRIYKQEYGRDLTMAEATLRAGKLLELFRILVKPPR